MIGEVAKLSKGVGVHIIPFQMLIDWYYGQQWTMLLTIFVNNWKYKVSCQVVEKIHIAECILQGSFNFSVYHSLSIILITDICIFYHPKCSTHCRKRTQKTCQSSQWHRKCIYMPLNALLTRIPYGIRNGIIWTPV